MTVLQISRSCQGDDWETYELSTPPGRSSPFARFLSSLPHGHVLTHFEAFNPEPPPLPANRALARLRHDDGTFSPAIPLVCTVVYSEDMNGEYTYVLCDGRNHKQ